MKRSEAIERFLCGEVLIVCEYLGSKAEMGTKREEGGKVAQFPILTHKVWFNNDAVPVKEDLRKQPDFDVATYKAPFRRGQRVILKVESLGKDKAWNPESRGTLHLLEDDDTQTQSAPSVPGVPKTVARS